MDVVSFFRALVHTLSPDELSHVPAVINAAIALAKEEDPLPHIDSVPLGTTAKIINLMNEHLAVAANG